MIVRARRVPMACSFRPMAGTLAGRGRHGAGPGSTAGRPADGGRSVADHPPIIGRGGRPTGTSHPPITGRRGRAAGASCALVRAPAGPAPRGDPGAGRTIDDMDADQVERARSALLEERARMVAELGAELDAPEQMTYGSQAAAASQVFAQQRDLALRDAAERRVREVDAALGRIGAGTFGRCTSCGGPIADARIEALPWAALCIDCQRRTGGR
jgi:RNA polymerase-binding transcription factor DksA